MSITKQIIGSFSDIGSEVIKEAASVPKDIAGSALESLGAVGNPKQSTKQPAIPQEQKNVEGALGDLEKTTEVNVKQAIARKALEELSGTKQQKEPSVYEKQHMEEQQKKEFMEKQAKQAKEEQLPTIKTKRKRGDLWGLEGKKSEQSKNVRQD